MFFIDSRGSCTLLEEFNITAMQFTRLSKLFHIIPSEMIIWEIICIWNWLFQWYFNLIWRFSFSFRYVEYYQDFVLRKKSSCMYSRTQCNCHAVLNFELLLLVLAGMNIRCNYNWQSRNNETILYTWTTI